MEDLKPLEGPDMALDHGRGDRATSGALCSEGAKAKTSHWIPSIHAAPDMAGY